MNPPLMLLAAQPHVANVAPSLDRNEYFKWRSLAFVSVLANHDYPCFERPYKTITTSLAIRVDAQAYARRDVRR